MPLVIFYSVAHCRLKGLHQSSKTEIDKVQQVFFLLLWIGENKSKLDTLGYRLQKILLDLDPESQQKLMLTIWNFVFS